MSTRAPKPPTPKRDTARVYALVAEYTAHCPCDRCPNRHGCKIECRRFKDWVQTGKPQDD